MNFGNFFFNATATTEIYTLSLHDALPIYRRVPADDAADLQLEPLVAREIGLLLRRDAVDVVGLQERRQADLRSEEHTSELQSQFHLVCRLLLEKKNCSTLPCDSLDAPPR